MMLNLVLWSFVMAISPLVLGVAWQLARGAGRAVDRGYSQALSPSSRPWRPSSYHQVHVPAERRPLTRGESWW
jgi:hypothetical protein